VPLAPFGAAAAIVALAGLTYPPLEQAQRALWPRLLPAEVVPRAYALDATAQGLLFVAGPPLVLAGVAVAGRSGGLVLAAILGFVGTVAFAAQAPSRAWRPAGRHPDAHWLGPLRSRRVVAIDVAFVLVGLTVGTLAVGLTAYAESHGHRSLGGWLLTGNAVGGFAGGIAFASRWSGGHALATRTARLTALFGLGWAALATLPPPAAMAVVAVACGVLLPPLLSCIYVAIDRTAPSGTISEAFGWSITAFLVGFSTGAAVAGALAGSHLSLAFLVGTATALGAAAIARVAIPQ
jgi:hypothetical protein